MRFVVAADRLGLPRLDLGENETNAVDGRKNESDRRLGRRRAVAQPRKQGLRGMRQLSKPRQAEKSARALDGMKQAEDRGDHRHIGRIALELHEMHARRLDVVAGLGQEIAKKLVHLRPRTRRAGLRTAKRQL